MSTTKWQPSPLDTTAYAAFRWFANSIENDSMELYATHRDTYEQIEDVLRNTLQQLADLRTRLVRPPDGGCPDGWILCHDVCAPSCDTLGASAKPK